MDSSVFDAKRLIGRKYDDAEVQSDIKHFPFKVFSKGGKPYIRVEYKGEEKEFVSYLYLQFVLKLINLFSSQVTRRNIFDGPP